MSEQATVQIKRRVKSGKEYVEKIQEGKIVKSKTRSFMVLLDNGDIIKRKARDLIWAKS